MKQRTAKKLAAVAVEREEIPEVLNLGVRAEEKKVEVISVGSAGSAMNGEPSHGTTTAFPPPTNLSPRVPVMGDEVRAISVSGKLEPAIVRRVLTPGDPKSVLHLAIFAKEYMGMDDVPKRDPAAPKGWTWDWPEDA